MLTKITKKKDEKSIKVQSLDERVQVSIDHETDQPLSREEAHEALIEAETVTHEFLAAVEADIEATAP